MPEIKKIERLVENIRANFERLLSISESRLVLIDENKNTKYDSNGIIQELKKQANTLLEYKEEYLKHINDKSAQNLLKNYLLQVIENQKILFDADKITKECNLLKDIEKDANEIKIILGDLIAEFNELISITENNLKEIQTNIKTEEDKKKLRIGKTLLQTAKNFTIKLSNLKILKETYQKFTKIHIDENVIGVYQDILKIEKETIKNSDLNTISDSILIEIKKEKYIFEALLMFEQNKLGLENLIKKTENTLEEIKGDEHLGLFRRLTNYSRAASITMLLSGFLSILSVQNVDASSIEQKRNAIYIIDNINEKTHLNLDSWSQKNMVEEEMLYQEFMNSPNKYRMLTTFCPTIIRTIVEIRDGNMQYLNILKDFDRAANELNAQDKADYYFARGAMTVELLREPLLRLPKVNSGFDWAPFSWMTKGTRAMFNGLNDVQQSSENFNLPTNYSIFFDEMMKHFMTAAKNGCDPNRIISFIHTNKDIEAFFSISKDSEWNNVLQGVYNSLADAYYEGEFYNNAYNMYYATSESGIINPENYVRMARSAYKQGKYKLAYETALSFLETFGPYDNIDKGVMNTLSKLKKHIQVPAEYAGNFFTKSEWRLSANKRKWLYVIPGFSISAKRIDDNGSKTSDEQFKIWYNYTLELERLLTDEHNTLFKIAVCEKYWNDERVVFSTLPRIDGTNQSKEVLIKWINLYEKAIKESRFYKRSIYDLIVSPLWEYYNANNMNTEKETLAKYYKEHRIN
jgi:hypothetical protein